MAISPSIRITRMISTPVIDVAEEGGRPGLVDHHAGADEQTGADDAADRDHGQVALLEPLLDRLGVGGARHARPVTYRDVPQSVLNSAPPVARLCQDVRHVGARPLVARLPGAGGPATVGVWLAEADGRRWVVKRLAAPRRAQPRSARPGARRLLAS